MSVVIKLQHLPVTATSHDIRHFFRSLSIPDGGVHIVGGTEGDVFIIFSTDEDARQAMLLSGSCLKDSPVTLSLSSGYEMSQVIEQTYHKALRTMKSLYKNKSSSLVIQSPPPSQMIPGSSALDSANSFMKNNPPPSVTTSNNNPPPNLSSPFAAGFISVANNDNNNYLPKTTTTMTTTAAAMVNHNFPGNLMVTQGQGIHIQGPPTNLFSHAPPQRNPYGPTIFNNMNHTNNNSSDSCTNAGMGFSGHPMSSNGHSLMNYPPHKPVMNGPWIHSFGSNHQHATHLYVTNNNSDNFPPGRHANHNPPNSCSNVRRNNNGPYRYGTVNRNGRRRPTPWIKMNHNNNNNNVSQ